MALNTKKEFATKCGGKSTNWLSNYIGRKKVEVNEQGYIDDAVEKNATFLKIWQSKAAPSTEATSPAVNDTNNMVKNTAITTKSSEQTDLFNNEKQKSELEIERKQLENELKRIEIAKKNGEVIPVSLVKATISQISKSILDSAKVSLQTFLTEAAVKYDINRNDLAVQKGRMIELLNAAADAAVIDSKNQVVHLVKEYSEKKGVGEREA